MRRKSWSVKSQRVFTRCAPSSTAAITAPSAKCPVCQPQKSRPAPKSSDGVFIAVSDASDEDTLAEPRRAGNPRPWGSPKAEVRRSKEGRNPALDHQHRVGAPKGVLNRLPGAGIAHPLAIHN